MTLNLNGEATQETLKQLETDGKNAVEATIDQDGIEAEISHSGESWSIAAYVKRLWKGPWVGGARVRKDF